MTRMYRIRNWSKYQHYKDRNPPWIKLHADLFTSEAWMLAPTDQDRLTLIVLMQFAARNDNLIPDNPAYLRKFGRLDGDLSLAWALQCEFLEECEPEDKWKSPWPSRYVSPEIREAVLKRDGYACVYCAATDDLEIDHIVPVSAGGTGQMENLQTLCRSCNRKKRTRAANATKAMATIVAVATQDTYKRSPETETQVRAETEKKESAPQAALSPAKPKLSLPDNFPDDEAIRRAQAFWNERGRPDLVHSVRDEVDQFRDHHLKLGNRFPNWPAAWRTWTRNALKFNKQTKVSAHDKGTEGAALYLASLERSNGTGHRDGAGEVGSGPRLLPSRHGREEVGEAVRDLPRRPEGAERAAVAGGLPALAQRSREHEIPDTGAIEGSVRPVQDILGAASRSLSSIPGRTRTGGG